MQRIYRIQKERLHVVRPVARRYIHFSEPPNRSESGWILCLLGANKTSLDVKKLLRVLSYRFPKLRPHIIRMHEGVSFSPKNWIKLLQQTRVCLYLTEDICDWPVLALEALYFRIPTLFLDDNSAMSELLPGSSLRLSRFLVEQAGIADLMHWVDEACAALTRQGAVDPLGLVKQYQSIYTQLGV